MTYQCETCGKAFRQRGHFDSHKARKRPCKRDTALDAIVEQRVQEALGAAPAISVAKPFLKWVGGKTQIIDEVIRLFPREIVNYWEPFVGGGSVLLALLSHQKAGTIRVTGRITASDLNMNLIHLYRTIQSAPTALIAEVKTLVAEFSECKGTTVNRAAATKEEATTSPESYYYWIRGRFNAATDRTTPAVAAMFLFLNKTCFRGVYREGPRGFNVPYGNYKGPTILDEEHIQTVSELIQGVEFRCCQFNTPLEEATAGDFVYLDPPYAPETETSFVGYTTDGFGIERHRALFGITSRLGEKGAKFLMSNADVKLVRDAFSASAFELKVVSCRRAIHCKKPDARTNEVLIRSR